MPKPGNIILELLKIDIFFIEVLSSGCDLSCCFFFFVCLLYWDVFGANLVLVNKER